MSNLEDKIMNYRDKVQEVHDLLNEIQKVVPPALWDRYNQIKSELPSDKSVIMKEIKDGKETIECDGITFRVSQRSRTTIPEEFLHTARDLGHLDVLVDLGVITGIKVNEDQLQRIDPELAGIYSNLVKKVKTTALTWPKKVDLP